jgi:serine/threonine protein kinase
VHEIGQMIHRDIKPENILIAPARSSQGNDAFLVDFGLAMSYHPKKTPRTDVPFAGTKAFASVNALHNIEQSRRDDLEALANVLIYLVCGWLPWEDIELKEGWVAALAIKKKTTNQFCLDLPDVFLNFRRQTQMLDFDQTPAYASYIAEFAKASEGMGKELVYSHYCPSIDLTRLEGTAKWVLTGDGRSITQFGFCAGRRRSGWLSHLKRLFVRCTQDVGVFISVIQLVQSDARRIKYLRSAGQGKWFYRELYNGITCGFRYCKCIYTAQCSRPEEIKIK